MDGTHLARSIERPRRMTTTQHDPSSVHYEHDDEAAMMMEACSSILSYFFYYNIIHGRVHVPHLETKSEKHNNYYLHTTKTKSI
jgi:hypothetical protein